MKVLMALSLLMGTVSASAPTRWYDSEVVHNTIHDYIEAVATLGERLRASDTRGLRDAVTALDTAANHMHDEMENDPEAPAAAILTAFRAMEAPFARFVVAVRENQLRGADARAHLYDALGIVEIHGRMKFHMTPAE